MPKTCKSYDCPELLCYTGRVLLMYGGFWGKEIKQAIREELTRLRSLGLVTRLFVD